MRDETKDNMRVLNPCSSSFFLLEAGSIFIHTGLQPGESLLSPALTVSTVSLCKLETVKTVPLTIETSITGLKPRCE